MLENVSFENSSADIIIIINIPLFRIYNAKFLFIC